MNGKSLLENPHSRSKDVEFLSENTVNSNGCGPSVAQLESPVRKTYGDVRPHSDWDVIIGERDPRNATIVLLGYKVSFFDPELG